MENYLKEASYYNDLYDLFTIKKCIRIIESWKKSYNERDKDPDLRKFSEKEKETGISSVLNLNLYLEKGERYRDKNKTIREWVERDKTLQDKYDNAQEPQEITCPACHKVMVCTFKTLEDYSNEPVRILFFFECQDCKKRVGIYENGKEHISKPHTCSKCGHEVLVSHTKKGKIITWIYKCKDCKFIEKVVDDFDSKKTEWEREKKADQVLLEKYRKEYCFSEKEGQEYITSMDNMNQLRELFEESKAKKENPFYQKAMELKKLNVSEMEKLLSEALEKEKYVKLNLDKPEMGKFVIIPFTVQDADSSRKEYASTSKMKKIVKTTLESTNWRLMSEGLFYRLGYVYGRLKGYEREEDLVELVGGKNEYSSSDENKIVARFPFSFEVDLKKDQK
jgi:predicted RNA-binding Zn-ribbon protein involved in translation (DUF1610 family)